MAKCKKMALLEKYILEFAEIKFNLYLTCIFMVLNNHVKFQTYFSIHSRSGNRQRWTHNFLVEYHNSLPLHMAGYKK